MVLEVFAFRSCLRTIASCALPKSKAYNFRGAPVVLDYCAVTVIRSKSGANAASLPN